MSPAEGEPRYGGLEDGFTQAIELVAVQVLFTLLGVWLDSRLGLAPLLTVVLSVIALVGNGARMFYKYRAKMEAAEEGKPWARHR